MWQNNRVDLLDSSERRRRQVDNTCQDPNGNGCEEIDPDLIDPDTTPAVSSGLSLRVLNYFCINHGNYFS